MDGFKSEASRPQCQKRESVEVWWSVWARDGIRLWSRTSDLSRRGFYRRVGSEDEATVPGLWDFGRGGLPFTRAPERLCWQGAWVWELCMPWWMLPVSSGREVSQSRLPAEFNLLSQFEKHMQEGAATALAERTIQQCGSPLQ